jgi:hypothetical protein
MAIFKIDEDFYIDGDQIDGIRWIDAENSEQGDGIGQGIIFYNGLKVGVNKEQFDKMRDAFFWLRGSIIYDGKKKITQGDK